MCNQERFNFHAQMFISGNGENHNEMRGLINECVKNAKNHRSFIDGIWNEEQTIRYTFEESLQKWLENEIEEVKESIPSKVKDNIRLLSMALLASALAQIDFKELANLYLTDYYEELEYIKRIKNERL